MAVNVNAKFSPSLFKTTIILTSQWESSVFTESRKVKFHKTFVSRLHLFLCWCLRWRSKWNYPYVAWLKATTNVHLKWILGKNFRYSRREENVGMRSKLPIIDIGGSSATFKSSLLVLFGPYMKSILLKTNNKFHNQ